MRNPWHYPSVALKVMEMQANQWKSREELELMQGQKLLSLVERARRDVPAYKNLPTIRSLDGLRSLPFTEKRDLRDSDGHISRQFDKSSLTSVPTSGSSGLSLGMYRTREDLAHFSMIQCSRFLSAGMSPLGLTGKVTYQRRNYFFWAPGLFRYLFVSMYEDEAAALSKLKKGRPDVLLSYPSSLIPLAHHNIEHGAGFTVPRVISNAEVLSPRAREYLSRSFGCTVRDVYGSVETAPIAFECENGSMHVHSDSQIVEVLDRNGEPAKAGREGEIVVTSLWPQAMPVIRYRLGDRVTLGGRCSCGRGSHTIAGIRGREADFIIMRSGKAFTGTPLFIYLRHFPDVLLFQAVQDEPGRLLLRIVPNGSLSESSRQGIVRRMNEHLPEPLDISIEVVKSLPRGRTGKISCLVSSIKPDMPI